MTTTPLLICTLLYLLTAFGFWREGNIGLAVAFTGYAAANCGFLYITLFGQP